MKERQGFTLIEILIVVAIIAILASVVLVGLGPTQLAGRDARRLSDLHQAQNGIELYYNKCGYYPGTSVASPCAAFTGVSAWGSTCAANTLCAVMTAPTNGLSIRTWPQDPKAGATYFYAANALGASYIVAATMEQGAGASVFNNYIAPSTGGYTFGNPPTSCAAPTYCASL